MKQNLITLISAISLLFAANAYAAEQNIYVDSSSGSSKGTYESPYKRFSDINWTTVQNWINSGYDVNINLRSGRTWNEAFAVNASGTSNHPVTIKAYGSGDRPRIDLNSFGTGVCFRVKDHDYIVVDGLDFRDAKEGLTLIATQYVVIKNCYFTNLHKGIMSNDAFYISVGGSPGSGNEFYNNGDDTGSSDISCASDSHDWVISHNHLHADSDIRGIDGILVERVYNVLIEYNSIHGHNRTTGNRGENAIDIKYPPTHDIIVRYNNLYDHKYEGNMHVQKGVHNIFIYGNRIANGVTGIMAAYGWFDDNANPYNIHIFSNLILNNKDKGICTGNGDPYDIYVYNNTIAQNGNNATLGFSSGIGFNMGKNYDIRNNIFINNEDKQDGDRRQLGIGSSEIKSTNLSNNLFYHSQDLANTKIYWGSGIVKASTVGQNNEVTNPGLDGEYHIKAGSIAINNGANLEKAVATYTITDGTSKHRVIDINYRESLDPNNTDWSVTPPKVGTILRSSSGTWTQGAYAYATTQNTLEAPFLSIKTQ